MLHLAFAPDGGVLASCGSDATVRLWQVPSGEPLKRIEQHDQSVTAFAWTPHGSALLTGSEDGSVRRWA